MTGKKTFVGYDFGDGESIIDMATLEEDAMKKSVQVVFKPVTMPDNNTPGQAIPSAFGYDENNQLVFASSVLADPEAVHDIRVNFKRKPSDLIPKLSDARKLEIIRLLKKGWPDSQTCPELNGKELLELKQNVLSFTNGVFQYPMLQKVIRDEAVDSEEIVFCVGHPTKWDSFDVTVYRAIFSLSVIGSGAYAGKKSSIIMAAESRAAFLYVKDKTQAAVLQKGTSALLIDVGSSTIDVTAMTTDSRNHQYNSGNNYLGARFFDRVIKDEYLEKMKENEEDYSAYERFAELNPTIESSVTLCCRKAKEEAFSVAAKKSKIAFGDFYPRRVLTSDIERIAEQHPVAKVLSEYYQVPKAVVDAMGNKSWKTLFKEFLCDTKAELDAQKIKIGRIILTGSASKMTFVPDIIRSVFPELPEKSILSDADPSRTISMGLALVGPSNEKSRAFQMEVESIIQNDVPTIVEQRMDELAQAVSIRVSDVVEKIALQHINEWRSMKINTLEEMTAMIEADCQADRLNEILTQDYDYNQAIKNWAVDLVGADVAVKLKVLCEKYGVSGFSLDALNVFKVSSVNINGLSFDPTEDIAGMVSTAISVIAGIITAIAVPFVLGVIIGIISWISVSLAAWLLELLLTVPGGIAVLAAIAGVAVIALVKEGAKGAKEKVQKKIITYNLPQWVRKRMKDEKVRAELKKADTPSQIKDAVLKEDSKEQIVRSVADSLSNQINKRVDMIKYVIESK